jgi:hypothetical protein
LFTGSRGGGHVDGADNFSDKGETAKAVKEVTNCGTAAFCTTSSLGKVTLHLAHEAQDALPRQCNRGQHAGHEMKNTACEHASVKKKLGKKHGVTRNW